MGVIELASIPYVSTCRRTGTPQVHALSGQLVPAMPSETKMHPAKSSTRVSQEGSGVSLETPVKLSGTVLGGRVGAPATGGSPDVARYSGAK